jgi:predicted DNA-binding transcriptional regulator AlpA
MGTTVDISRNVPRLGLNRSEVALAIGVSVNTVDLMVEEGFLPRPRKWHSRKVWLVAEVAATMSEWPEDGIPKQREDADDGDGRRASAWQTWPISDLPYVEKNKIRHGTTRYYLRIDGARICRLPDDINSEEFTSTYWKAHKAAKPAMERVGEPKAEPNSFRWLCMEYMRSNSFTSLDQTTQTRRRNIMESMWAEPLSDKDDRPFSDIPLPKLTVSHLEVLRDRKREAPFAADERLKVLRQVFDTRKDTKPVTTNIARLVEPFNEHSDGHETATPDDIAKFIEHHGTGSTAVLYVAIQMYTGFRVSDLAVLGPQHRRKDSFKLRLFKNRNRTPVDIDITIHPILEAVLATHKVTAMTFLVTEFGKPFSVKGLGTAFRTSGDRLACLTSPLIRCERDWLRMSPTTKRPTACSKPCSAGRIRKRRRFTRGTRKKRALHGRPLRRLIGMESVQNCCR